MRETYTHGHHESVLRSHKVRTVENSAAYLLPHLAPGQRLVDLGCGPGTISLDLAARIDPGTVTAIDAAREIVEQAEQLRAERGIANASFAVGDAYALEHPDASFDVAHAHQVLQHLADPVAALVELRRVLRPGGLLAVRDSDYGGFFWAPADPRLDRWLALYHAVTARNSATSDAGRFLPSWVHAAGFRDAVVSSSTWTYADPQTRTWWGGLWADRVRVSAFAKQAREYGLASDTDLAEMADAFLDWAAQPQGCFVVPHVEVLARA
jgi:ubiquinone/menaquinone biosynthesis C-methylase UbiE